MIKDSGNRTEFESGAVRDMHEGKGRCDLLPLGVIQKFTFAPALFAIEQFQQSSDIKHLKVAIEIFIEDHGEWKNSIDMILEVAKHFEDGAKKYGENNWQKGIPVKCYIDSAVRHYLKYLRGDTDERHDRAFCWNIMCAIWTCNNKPELNDYAKSNEEGVE